jgi:hypothetical protein
MRLLCSLAGGGGGTAEAGQRDGGVSWVKGPLWALRIAEMPPHPTSSLRSEGGLSPQAEEA